MTDLNLEEIKGLNNYKLMCLIALTFPKSEQFDHTNDDYVIKHIFERVLHKFGIGTYVDRHEAIEIMKHSGFNCKYDPSNKRTMFNLNRAAMNHIRINSTYERWFDDQV